MTKQVNNGIPEILIDKKEFNLFIPSNTQDKQDKQEKKEKQRIEIKTMSKLAILIKKHNTTIPKLIKELTREGADITQQTLYNAITDGRMSLETARILAKHFKVPIEEVIF